MVEVGMAKVKWGRLSEKYLIDNQLRGPDSSSTLKKADETNLK